MGKVYLKETGKFIKTILDHIPECKKKVHGQAEDLETFIKELYEFVPAEDLYHLPPKGLCVAAASLFNFMQNRPKGTPKLRIYNPEIKSDGWESDHTVIEIVNDDMPFLVDSVTEEIARYDLTIYQLAHPVLEIGRDKQGKFKHLKPIERGEVGKNTESVMHIRVSHISNPKLIKELEKDLLHVFKAVRLIVEDWQFIVKKVNYIITEFTASVEVLSRSLQSGARVLLQENALEIREFLEWLKNNNCVFLGYTEYAVTSGKKPQLTQVSGSELGVFKLRDKDIEPRRQRIIDTADIQSGRGEALLEVTKANKKSIVHRPVHMDYILIRRFDQDGNMTGEHRLLGMFTSVVYHQSARMIPLIRKKIEYVQKRSGFSNVGHSGKALVAVLEDFPRDELFQMPDAKLFDTAMGIVALSVRPRVRLFVRQDDLQRFMSCIIFIPKDMMSTDLRLKMEKILKESFQGTISNQYTQITEAHLARLQIIVKIKPGQVMEYDVAEIEKRLANAARLWEDGLQEELSRRLGEKEGERFLEIYRGAFSLSYKNRFSAVDAYYDIKQIEAIITEPMVRFDLYQDGDKSPEILHLKIYSPEKQIALSKIMPMLENMGLHTIDEHTYSVEPSSTDKTIWIHRFRFTVAAAKTPKLKEIKANFETALTCLWGGDIQNDALNKLIIWARLEWRLVALIRAYGKYLQQLGFTYSQAFIHEALGNHPELVRMLADLFVLRFDPALKGKRDKQVAKELEEIEKALGRVSNLAEDRVIRAMLDLINATIRTNFFQTAESGKPKAYISFKFNSSKIPFLPKPKPYAEIFVYSPRVEGIHLRGGKVARGGLRWSDRREDFRTEVLGLMKAQMVKNSVIIPVGSKGGFVVKRPPKEGGREAFMKEGVECYKIFLRGLLDITDNIVGGKVKPPVDVVRYDNDDPYLVVAADKGTATFSDIANSVSMEYQFWLGDAFASGGSAGYDHKKMAITARGGWISVQRHFSEMGIDVQRQDFTVVGIGDMAGDVFGNGMLCSKHIKLVGAFNHLHIFIDPEPDAQASFAERKRLFNLPRSTWMDYDAKLISKGGGVFERSAKSIKLSKQIKDLLEIEAAAVTPDELIRALLTAKVDLLWNGGIGTYVKSRQESHEHVGDKANDPLRVNGADLRAKVVGEGGNLGMTQRGRIEYALAGGRLNTDAIDNSAGVDCSDHEVNIKIALGKAIENKKLTIKRRDTLLESMTDEVAELVLRDNFLQTQILTIDQQQGHSLLNTQARMIGWLERNGYMDRAIEFLPDDEELAKRNAEGKGLTRPELSVVLAYSKLTLYEALVKTDLPEDSYYVADLMRYFPEKLQQQFAEEIESHPLRKEIIATVVTNSIINRAGSTLFYHLQEDTGMGVEEIARAYTIARDVFGLRQYWEEIEALNTKVSVETIVELFVEIQGLMERISLWFLKHQPRPLKIAKIIKEFSPGVQELSKCLTHILAHAPKENYQRRLEQFLEHKVPEALAKKMAGLDALASACDIVHVASAAKLPVDVVGRVYFDIGSKLQLGWMRRVLQSMACHSYWDKTSISTVVDELFDQQRRLTAEVIKSLCGDISCSNSIGEWVEQNQAEIERYDRFMADLKTHEEPSLAMIIVAVRKVKEISSTMKK